MERTQQKKDGSCTRDVIPAAILSHLKLNNGYKYKRT